MTCIFLNVVLCITVAVTLSQRNERPKQKRFRHSSIDFNGILLHRAHSSSKIGCLGFCYSHHPRCSFARFNSATKECQLLGYPMNEMSLDYTSNDDWEMFGEVSISSLNCTYLYRYSMSD